MKRLFTPDWVFPKPVEVPEALRREIGGSDLFLQMLVRRGFADPQAARAFLDPNCYKPCSALELPGMDKALLRLLQAIQSHERIGIWGDFDVDGQTSTAVLVSGLRRLGCDVVYHVPVRGPESHGISIPYLQHFLETGVRLIITCDTGISASDAIAYASDHGLETIVTDHHALPENLPEALALIDPQFLQPDHPLRTLSGVGVAYKLIEALYAELGKSGEEEDLLDLVALGLIADVATLTGDARYLVQRGLRQIRTSPRLSLATIFKENQVVSETVNETVVSFVIAPRLNAVGRLGDANRIVEFLLTDDPVLAATIANQIEGLNSDRRIKCGQVFKSAQSILEADPRLLEKPLLYLGHPDWPTGVVGIVASRLVELYHRPAILFNTSDAEVARGSARSVDGINIIAAIAGQKSLLTTYGGHPMAAGLSVPAANFDALKFALVQTITRMAEASDYHPTIEVDAQVDLQQIDMKMVNELQQIAPFGPGNPPILFSASDLEIESVQPMGRSKEHEMLILSDNTGNPHKVVWWQSSELPHPSARFDLAFSASISVFKGKTQLQLEWNEFRECETELAVKAAKTSSKVDHIDLRSSSDPFGEIRAIAARPDTIVYAEGTSTCPVPSLDRNHLSPVKTLVLWTVPPSPSVLHDILNVTKPQRVYWAATRTEEEDLSALLKRVGAALKSNPEHVADFSDLSARYAATSELVRQVILWYGTRGNITIVHESTEQIEYSLTAHPAEVTSAVEIQRHITALHNETAAFREYYRKVTLPASLLPDKAKHAKKSTI